MPKYRVARQSFIGGRVYEVGEELEFDDIPSDNLEPLDAAAKKARSAAEEHFKRETAERMAAANPEAAALGAAVAAALEKGEPLTPKAIAPVYREDAPAERGRAKI